MKLTAGIFIAIAVITGCKKQQETTPFVPITPVVAPPVNTADTALTYLALGDSYTIGQSVPAMQSFPFQLTAQLNNNNYRTANPKIIAQTGWTTADLKRAIADSAITKKYSFVTLLIGVNNQFQNGDTTIYRNDFDELVNTSIKYAKGNLKHVFVLSIPDWSVTPYAASSGRNLATIKTQINRFNSINERESKRLGVNYLNITDISRLAANNQNLLANDGLHPSGLMYLMWVKLLLPQVVLGLKQ
ncbi:MAG: SGNH/GDSL hydrolase family protein [Mucilaginibacter sp.]|uniref:SGNH/GDSL hydrolase family protein n=1 Tax=Mucilaginibacter sp. TaxID=1882438 RepID=UPI0034E54870